MAPKAVGEPSWQGRPAVAVLQATAHHMNRLANQRVVEPNFEYIWSLPNPGDACSAIGAVLYHTKNRIDKHNTIIRSLTGFGVVKHIGIRV